MSDIVFGENALFTNVQQTIRDRKTTKVMSTAVLSPALSRESIETIVDSAHWAPFHRMCDPHYRCSGETRFGDSNNSEMHLPQLPGVVPWRVHALDGKKCREIREQLPEANTGKMPMMLASAEAVLQVTWLPSNSEGFVPTDSSLYESSLLNMEHIAAASAAIQNILLSATAAGIPSYWSSGGALRFLDTMQSLGIFDNEILLGSIFLFPVVETTKDESIKVVSSKLRDKRGQRDDWFRWV